MSAHIENQIWKLLESIKVLSGKNRELEERVEKLEELLQLKEQIVNADNTKPQGKEEPKKIEWLKD